MPLREESLRGVGGSSRNLWVLGRRRKDVSFSQIDKAVRGSVNRADELGVLPYTGTTPDVAEGRSRVGTLLGVAADLVFFIACINVTSFLIGRASSRSHETALRVALGAGRPQLVRGLLSDSIVISVIGGAFGLILALWTSRVLPALLFEGDAERLTFSPDVLSIVTASAACIGITIACGLLPVFVLPTIAPRLSFGVKAVARQRESSAYT